MEIGTIIKKHRRERDMTQEQLAEYLRAQQVQVGAVDDEKFHKSASLMALRVSSKVPLLSMI